jgi:general secretion pathway protein D
MSTSLLKADMGASGLQLLVGNPDRWTATLNALATDNKVNILSSPTILASNSLPATIDISQEIPITTSQYQYTSDVNSGLLETSIEYRDTGVMLSVTPNINELGLVTMEIDQEVSEQAPNVSVGGTDYPSFYKRSTQTTLTVQSGQTIVIGGLIRENSSDGIAGVPWFITLPGIRWLFGAESKENKKTELIIMISPYVLDDFDDVDAVTQEFKKKVVHLFPEAESE